MKKTSDFVELAKGISNVAQLGLSVVVPIVLCGYFGVFLKKKFAVPDFVVALIVLLGVAAGISSALSFFRDYLKKANKEADELALHTGYRVEKDKDQTALKKINKGR